MNKLIMLSIYSLFGTNPDYNDFTMDWTEDLLQKLIDNPEQGFKTIILLQNNLAESNSLAK